MNIVFLDRDSIPSRISLKKPTHKHQWQEYPNTSSDQIVERLKFADVAISNKVPMNAEVMRQLSKLKMIGVAATGTDLIDLDYCKCHGIEVRNVNDYTGASVPEHALMLMLMLARQLPAYHRDVLKGKWQKSAQFCLLEHPIVNLSGSTLGIVGYGVLGKTLSEYAKPLGMNVVIAARKEATTIAKGRMPFKEVLKCSDFVSLHCPLNAQTHHLIGMNEFKMMKRSAILINTARGGVVHESDLVKALQQKIIGGAGVDVLTKEPPTEGNPILDVQLPNLIVTPHIAWGSDDSIQRLVDQLIDSIDDFMAHYCD